MNAKMTEPWQRWEAVHKRFQDFDQEHGVFEYMHKAGSYHGVTAYANSDRQLVRINVLGHNWRDIFNKWNATKPKIPYFSPLKAP